MQAHDDATAVSTSNADDTIPTWQSFALEPAAESTTRLAAERPTLPPPRGEGVPAADDVMVSRIHLGPSVDEVLYRLSLGDLSGAALANQELEDCIPVCIAAPVVMRALGLDYLEEYVLATVDGVSSWGDILDDSAFSPRDTLKALCELVDKGALTLTR